MADTEKIDKDTLPEFPKSYLKLDQTTNEMSTNFDDQYLFRILIDKNQRISRRSKHSQK